MIKITLFLAMVLLGLLNFNATAQGTWSLQTNPVQSTANVGKVQFVSATEGWISISNGFMLHTVNAGSTWTELANPYPSDVVFSMSDPGLNVSFINASRGWIIKSFGSQSNPQGAVIYKTYNGGYSWSRDVLSTTAGDAAIQVQFIDATHGWALIYNMTSGTPTFLKTTDGGATWNATNGGGIFYYLDANTGWAYSAGPSLAPPYTIYKTTNGGTSWTPQYTDNTTGELTAMQFTDLNHGWVIGKNGKVFNTSNGGTTWNVVTNTGLTTNHNSKSLFFLNSNVGWIGSKLNGSTDNAIILKTTDGGLNWTSQSTPAMNPFSISFWDENNGWFTSDDNKIVHYSTTTGTYSNANLNGPWLGYTGASIDPYEPQTNYLVFNGLGSIIDGGQFPAPTSGNYSVNPNGSFSGTLIVGMNNIPFTGQFNSLTETSVSANGLNFTFHKIANPGALRGSLTGSLTTTGGCGTKNVVLNIDSEGKITSATGLAPTVVGRVYADLGIFYGHMKTGETSNGWNEFSIKGYYSSPNLNGQLELDWISCNSSSTVTLVHSDNLGVEENTFNNLFTVYPNPNNGLFYFNIKEPKEKLQIEIYNFLGQKVYETINQDQKITNEIYFEPQGKGVYFIKIYDGENTYKEKILIK